MKYNEFNTKKTINCRGKMFTLEKPIVMGIINCTPDSFYSKSRVNISSALLNAKNHIKNNANILDIGGHSSRPNNSNISEEEEINRVLPILKKIREEYPNILISIDTFRSNVLKACLEFGIDFVNDISGGILDIDLPKLAAKNNIPYIVMHMRGNTQNMMKYTEYKNLLMDINYYFSERISTLKSYGIKDIILDPGFGFSKTIEQNFDLLKELHQIKIHNLPLMVGLSRKSMIYKTLELSPEESLNGTTALNMIALNKGAKILRVHDSKEANECIKLFEKFC